jgi:PKD repeat protein
MVVGPAANAGGPYSGVAGSAIAVSGAASVAPTGSLTRYSWNWGDGTMATTATTAAASHVYAASGTYTITLTVTDNAGATAAATTTAAISSATTSLPSPWLTQDIGSVGLTGSATYSSGRFTVAGAGADIWGTVDAFRYVYRTLSGNGQIIARVASMTNTNTYAKAGVMIRNGLQSGSAHALVNFVPSGGVEFLARPGFSQSTKVAGTAAQTLPGWLRLVRSGSTITASVSRDGSAWTQIGSTTVSLGTTAYVGLAVTSHNTSVRNTATFDSVAVTSSTATTTTLGPGASGDIVIYASDVPSTGRHGVWTTAGDGLSPNGLKLTTPNSGLAWAAAPLASPQNYVDVTFSAVANTPYRLWLRVRAASNSKYNDSLWVQFSDALVNGGAAYRMNTTAGLLVNLATDFAAGSLQDWGWTNGAYWLSQGTVVTFPTSGTHTIRIQIREDGVQFDQIVLSPSRYRYTRPGAVSGDVTIVPKN